MRIIRAGTIVACFSERSDGNLFLSGMGSPDFPAKWQSFKTVAETGIDLPRFATQVHGTAIHEVTTASPIGNQGEGDALVTRMVKKPIGVFTADCLPILLWGDDVQAAIHAGWKGTNRNIVGETVTLLKRKYDVVAGALHVAMGPCIGQCCLEVGEEVVESFQQVDSAYLAAFSRGTKWHLDLRALNVIQCLEAGIKLMNIGHVNDCTMCNPEKYFSYRYQHERSGSMFSFVFRLSSL